MLFFFYWWYTHNVLKANSAFFQAFPPWGLCRLQHWQCSNILEKMIQYFLEKKRIPHSYFAATLREKQASLNRLIPASKQKNKTGCVNIRRSEKAVRFLVSLVNHRKHPGAYWVKEHDLRGLCLSHWRAAATVQRYSRWSVHSAHSRAEVLSAEMFLDHRVALRARLFWLIWSDSHGSIY